MKMLNKYFSFEANSSNNKPNLNINRKNSNQNGTLMHKIEISADKQHKSDSKFV